jgi:hypothetical protein
MLFIVKDDLEVQKTTVIAGQENVSDRSGLIAATGVSQVAIQPDAARSGWFFMNVGTHPMTLNELGAAATLLPVAGAGSFVVAPGAVFPPPGFPTTVAAIGVQGTAGDGYVARSW